MSNIRKNSLLQDNIIAVLTKKIFDTLGEIKHHSDDLKYLRIINCYIKLLFRIEGYATKMILSGSMQSTLLKKDIIFFYVNKRPINMNKKMIHVLSELYKQFNATAKYCVILNFTMRTGIYFICQLLIF